MAQKKVRYDGEQKDFCQSLDHFGDHMTNYWFVTHQISYQARYRNNLLGQKSGSILMAVSDTSIGYQRSLKSRSADPRAVLTRS